MAWPFIDGKAAMSNVDLDQLSAVKFLHVLMYMFEQEQMLEKEMMDHRDKVRLHLMKQMNGYNNYESYGMTNDDFGSYESYGSEEPLPYIEPTQQTEDGYLGLDPPMN